MHESQAAQKGDHSGNFTSRRFFPSLNRRLPSLDALRGFDMFWLLGGDALFATLFATTGWPLFAFFDQQMQHSDWHGLRFYDLIFPLFIFISGVTLGLAAQKLKSLTALQQYRKALTRCALLIVLGVFYNHGWGLGVPTDLTQIRYASVLSRIGIAGLGATLLIYHCSLAQQGRIAVMVFVLYCALQSLFPLTATASLNGLIDQHVLPGVIYHHRAFDPEGFYGDLGAVFNALAGAWIGLQLANYKQLKHRLFFMLKWALLTGAAAALLNLVYPMNKSLWTGSFVLASVSCSIVFLCLFHALFDAGRWSWLQQFFAVIGVNAILAYLATSLFDWPFIIKSTVAPWIALLPDAWHTSVTVLAVIAVQWLVLFWLHRQRAYLKV